MKRRFVLLLLLLLSWQAFSQPNGVKITKSDVWQKTRILFILDCSKSMKFKWQSDTKIKIAQTILTNIIDSLRGRDNVELALRTFGNNEDRTSETCNDSYLDVSFSKNNMEMMKSKLKALVPKGMTPLAYSLSRCEEDFPDCDNCRNIVILITDGMDDCNENPCEVSTTLQQNGRILTPFVIGIGSALRSHLECIGNYYETTNEIEFSQVLNAIIAQLLDKTTCQVNLLDSYMEANETNIPISFYDHQSQLPKYTYMHTFNAKGLSDTLILDPLLSYDLVAHTIPQVKVENIKLLPAKHTIIPVQVPQGSIVV
ncbi:MAG: VWA domain-containing protein, partial [Bacteroidales bacterium]|nr:VWA domain-containing protein [Bacteroidales bacterium]